MLPSCAPHFPQHGLELHRHYAETNCRPNFQSQLIESWKMTKNIYCSGRYSCRSLVNHLHVRMEGHAARYMGISSNTSATARLASLALTASKSRVSRAHEWKATSWNSILVCTDYEFVLLSGDSCGDIWRELPPQPTASIRLLLPTGRRSRWAEQWRRRLVPTHATATPLRFPREEAIAQNGV